MATLLRLPSVGVVVHMTAERCRLFRLRTVQPSLSAPDGRYSLLPSPSVLPLPIGCFALQASQRHSSSSNSPPCGPDKTAGQTKSFNFCLFFLRTSACVQSIWFNMQGVKTLMGHKLWWCLEFWKRAQNKSNHTRIRTFNTVEMITHLYLKPLVAKRTNSIGWVNISQQVLLTNQTCPEICYKMSRLLFASHP